MFENEGAGAGAGVPAGSPPAPAPGGSAAPPAAGGAPPSPGGPAAQPVDQLRREYETTKSKLEPWEKLGAKPEDVQRSHQTYTKMYTEATSLGTKLGYDAAELQTAFQTDPVGTLQVLRQMVQQASGTPEKPLTRAEMERIADLRAKDAVKPFQQEREQRLDRDAESKFDGEFDRQLKTSFPDGLPDSAKEALQGLAWALLIENKEAYGALRAKGDVAPIAKAFTDAKTTLLRILSDYGDHEKKRVGGVPREKAPAAPGKKPSSIDDIINNLGNQKIPMSEVFGS